MKNSEQSITYEAVFEEQKEGGFTAYVPALPGCISEGDSFEETKKNILEAVVLYIESLAKDGQEIPQNSSSIYVGQIVAPLPA